MGLAVASHAGNRHILHAAPDAVLLQHVEHVVKGGIVGNDADMVAAGLQRFQRFQNVAPQLPVVIGHLPEIGQLLRNDNALLRQGNGRPVRPLPQGDKIPQLLLIRRHDQVS